MRFKSKLAERIASKRDGKRSWKTYACLVGAIFIVVNLAAVSLAAPSAVIHVGSKTTVVEFLGSYDGKTNVISFSLTMDTDSAYIRIPFKGHLSDLYSLSFSERVEQTGGGIFEPYIVLLMPGDQCLVCHPQDSYESAGWYLPTFEWQSRNLASFGLWSTPSSISASSLKYLSEWTVSLGDPQIIAVQLSIGQWDLSQSYSSLLGDLSINGNLMNIANAKRI